MIKVYYNLVKNGKWDIDTVPDLWRGGVQVLLDADEAAEGVFSFAETRNPTGESTRQALRGFFDA